MSPNAYNHPRRRNQRSAAPRHRILSAATQLFADKGFHNTTTRMISEQAQTNVAAVNYYFRSKEQLYEAVFESAFTSFAPLVRLSRRVQTQAQWEQALYRWLFTILDLIFDESPQRVWQLKLYERARMEPTRVYPVVCEKFLYPIRNALQDLLRLGLPANVPPATLTMWTLATIGQFLIFIPHGQPADEDLFPPGIGRKQWAAAMARHITASVTARLTFRAATAAGGQPRTTRKRKR